MAGALHRGDRRTDLVLLVGVLSIAIVIRSATLGEQSFWLDECYTVRLVRLSLGGMLHAIPSSESTPPLYYLLAWAWARLFGFSEIGLRSLSALAGVLTVAVVFAVSRRLGERRGAVIAGLLVALSPILVWYSQEARAYSLAVLLAACSLACLLAFLETGSRRWLLGWTLAACLGLATHYFLAFVLVPELGWLLWRSRGNRWVLAACAAAGAAAVALTPLALTQFGTGHIDYIAQASLATRLAKVPKQFLVGFATPHELILTALAGLLAGAAAILLISGGAERRRGIATPLVIGLCGVLIPSLLAFVGADFLDTRNVLVALSPLLVVLGVGLARAPRAATVLLTAGLAGLFLLATLLVDLNPRYQRDDWRGAARALGPLSTARAIVVMPGSGWVPVSVYLRGVHLLRRAIVREVDVVAIPAQVTGGGIGRPPRLRTGAPAPAGFRLAGVRYADTYTVVRYTALRAVLVTRGSIASAALGGNSPAVLVQTSRRTAG